MINQGLYDRNLGFLQKHFPQVYDQIAMLDNKISQPVIEDGVIIDLNLGSGRLYKGDGRLTGDSQAASFIAAPSRSGYKSVEGIASDSIVSRRYYDQIHEALKDVGVDAISPEPLGRASFMFTFGIGLGFHLAPLIEGVDVEHVVIVEAVDEFLSWSLRAIDWSALHKGMEERNQVLHLFVNSDPVVLAGNINRVIEAVGEMFLDGAYFFRHYPFWALDEAYKRIRSELPMRMVGRGYYEDERKMIRHGVVNLHKFDHYLVRGQFRRRHGVPAFIVAAGPSLDESIEYLRQWKDHGIIFSAGTTLQALVKAGIMPDYHIELENVATTHQVCMHILEQRPELFPDGRFTGTKMIASTSVSPLVPPLFDENYFFYRDCAVSTTCFGEGIEIMNGVGPSISNTCISVAARLGFENMYLFGVDCGWRDPCNHHSKNTMYYTLDGFKTDRFDGEFSSPGNFGGTVYSNLIFTWTRDMIEQKVKLFGLKMFNCSDGAYIHGTTPKLPESLFFANKPLDKEAVFQRIRDESEFFAAGAFLAHHDMARYIAEVDHLRADFLALLDQAEAEKIDFRLLVARLTDFHREGSAGPYKHVYALFQGSIVGFTKAASYFINRIYADGERIKFLERFLAIYRSLHEEMLDEGRTIFVEAKIMVEGGAEPEWADGKPRVPGTSY
ncbi:motility associated factor glycosyltransferase family protein [Magnetospirillum sulfuroxidans]|uniref:Motility associated factor glycosyltransferase family protein n=1 Tax=Magnetospirillum sulfuroxidans TaxID=611300 RepID=A0ABS5IC89_9PROT|nr:6-hydroxymethylpterin diphosphokinase MptE-like protein [Magnetospirillum sulfuroxidans]MBR9971348.1 motility associated factor glycosyltransferase family protein [Magnetospirillum sulfuroxidans]